MTMSTITKGDIMFDTEKLPADCKIFLDCLDLVNSTESSTLEEHLLLLEEKKSMLIEMLENESLKKDINSTFVDALLDNKARIEKTITFLNNHFRHEH
jgi:hypothetical protein